jgi:hypothetical protein
MSDCSQGLLSHHGVTEARRRTEKMHFSELRQTAARAPVVEFHRVFALFVSSCLNFPFRRGRLRPGRVR